MELKERSRAASWSTPKMASKVDREWQNLIDGLEKRITENIDRIDKK